VHRPESSNALCAQVSWKWKRLQWTLEEVSADGRISQTVW